MDRFLAPEHTLAKFGRGLIGLTPARFSHLVSQLKSGAPRSFSDWKLSNVDLRLFTFDGFRFFNCEFSGVTFGQICNAEFSNCRFSSVLFNGEIAESTTIEKTIFFECTFHDCSFNSVDFNGVTIADSNISSKELIFRECTLRGNLIIDSNVAYSKIISASDIETSTHAPSRIIYSGYRTIPTLNWSSIRFLAKIPFLQISLTSVFLIFFATVIIDGILSAFELSDGTCRKFSHLIEHYNIGINCDKYSVSHLRSAMFAGYLELVLVLITLLVASTIQLIAAPQEVNEYSKAQWIRDVSRPSIQYDMIAAKRQFALYFVIVLYSIISLYVIFKYVLRLIYILTHLLK